MVSTCNRFELKRTALGVLTIVVSFVALLVWAPGATAGSFRVSPPTSLWLTESGYHSTAPSDNRMLADVTGDGRLDAVSVLGSGKWYIASSTGSSFNLGALWISGFIPPVSSGNRTLTGDVNGDGRSDAVKVDGTQWTAALSTGATFGSPVLWSSSIPNYSDRPMLADVNGDGKADAVSPSTGGTWRVALSNGSAFAAQATWATSFGSYTGGSTTIKLMTGDVNGDGRQDAVIDNGGNWSVALSNGAAFGTPQAWRSGFGPATGVTTDAGLADVDGDGLADALANVNGARLVARSTGYQFSAPTTWTTDFMGPSSGVSAFPYYGDVTGDGKSDAVAAGNLVGTTYIGRWWVAPSVNAVDDLKAPGSGWTIDFNDEFTGNTLNTSNWNPQRDDIYYPSGHPYNTEGHPYHADEQAYYEPANNVVNGGVLTQLITPRVDDPSTVDDDNYPYSTGMIHTNHLHAYSKGYIEAKIRVPAGCSGCWPAFWMMTSAGGRPPEVDIFEYFPANADLLHPYFTSFSSSNVMQQNIVGNPSRDFRGDWHTYGLLWTDTAIQIFIDGAEGPIYIDPWVPHVPMFIIIQSALARTFTPSGTPSMQTDYVKVYQPPS